MPNQNLYGGIIPTNQAVWGYGDSTTGGYPSETTPQSQLTLSSVPGPVFNVKDPVYGAKGDGVTDDTAAITSALTAGSGGTVFVPKGTYAISGATALTIPSGTNFIIDYQAVLVYTGTGTAVFADGGLGTTDLNPTEIVLRIRRASRGWNGGTDSTSKAFRIRNKYQTRVTLPLVQDFETAVEVVGDGSSGAAGSAYNDFFIDRMINNRRGFVATAISGGYSNSNTVYGGAIRIDGALGGSMVGSRYVDLSEPTANGWAFINVGMENNAVEENVRVGGAYNVFVNCRFDTISKIHLLSTSRWNEFFGGYGLAGIETSFVQDDGLPRQNVVVGSSMPQAHGLRGLPTGRYWAPPHTTGTATPANTVLHFTRIVIARPITIQSLGVEITGAGSAGAVVRLGIYDEASDGTFPGNLIRDAGTAVATGTGFTEIALSGNQLLSPGVYWLLAVSQGGATTPPTYRSTNAGAATPAGSDYQISSTTAVDMTTNTGVTGGGYQCGVFTISGALPATMVGTGATYNPGQNVTVVVIRGA